MSLNNFVAVANITELALGKTLCVELSGREILLCHTQEGIFAVDNICSHAAEKLNNGKLKGHRILCPLHGAAFDVRDGSVLSRPATLPLRSYPVHIENDTVHLAIVTD